MRALAIVAACLSVVIAGALIVREPRPETKAQIAARQAAETFARDRMEASGLPQRLETGASRRGRLAWVAVDRGGAGPESHRHTMALLRDREGWEVMIEHDAPVLTAEALRAGAEARATPEPDGGDERYRGDRRSLDKRFRRWLAHPGKARIEREVIAVGPTSGEFAVGDSAVKVLFADWERDYGELRLEPGGSRVWVAPGGGAGWVTADVEARPPSWGGTAVRLRLTAVYRSRGENSWGLALVHLSADVPNLVTRDSGIRADAEPPRR